MSLVFGKYEKIRRIAQGGMGEVFLARQTGVLDRLAILKALRPDLAKEKEFVEQFLDEARVAATLNHPNIVAIYDVGDWNNVYYIAMEYIAGEDLSKLWYAAAKAGVGLPFQVSVRIVMEAGLGLDHAHRAKDVRGQPLNIVHRDISPQNIMVRADGVTKLVDFGIAKAANKSSRTQAGMVKGKLQYMSPEQVRGEHLDGRSDQFSLGIVIWEMCTGRRLFKADSEIKTLQKILQDPIPKPSQHVPGFPPELEAIIMRTLERDPGRRFNTLGDVSQRLKEYLDRSSLQSGEVSVAAFVQQILGKELEERTRDLTPMEPTEVGGTPQRPTSSSHPTSYSSDRSSDRAGDRSARGSQPRRESRPAASAQRSRNDDHDPPTAVVSPEDRPDARDADSRDDGLGSLPSGPTGEYVVRKADGSVVHFQEWATLQQWVLDGKLSRDDQLSTDGRRFARLGDDGQLAQFFATAEAASQAPRAAGRSQAPQAQQAQQARKQAPLAVDPAPSGQTSTTTDRRVAVAGGETIPLGDPELDNLLAEAPDFPSPASTAPPSTAPASSAPGNRNDPQPKTPTPLTNDPFAAPLGSGGAMTGAFSLGSLPQSQTGQWQIGGAALQNALQQASAGPTGSSVPPGDRDSMALTTDPRDRMPVRKKRVPVALWALVGVLGSFVAIAVVLRVAFPDTLQKLREGDRATLAHARAALQATRKDEPATVDALLQNLSGELSADTASVDADVAAALLHLERWRVLRAASLIELAAIQRATAPKDPKDPKDPKAAKTPTPTPSMPSTDWQPALAAAQKHAARAGSKVADEQGPQGTWARFAKALVEGASSGSVDNAALERIAVIAAPVAELVDEANANQQLQQSLAALSDPAAPAATADAAVDAFDRRAASLRLLVDAVRATDPASARAAVDERLKKSPSDPRFVAARALLGGPDTVVADGKQPDGKQPDTKQPDGKRPDTKQPDTKQPDAKQPDVKQPDTKQVDAGVAVAVTPTNPTATNPATDPTGVADAGVAVAAPVEVEETYDSALAKAQKAQKSGRTGEAAKMFRLALQKKPGDNKAELGLSWSQIDLGKLDAAAKGFKNIVARDPGVAEAQFGLGEALRGAGRTTEAIAAYEKYLEIAPTGPDAETAKNAIRALQ